MSASRSAQNSPAPSEKKERETREEAHFTEIEGPASDNRRVHSRYGVDLDVSLESDHNFYAGFAENISTGGLFIATYKLKPVGARMDISLNLPGRDAPIQTIGEVRWIREYSERSNVGPGMGIRFVELKPEDAAAISDFVKGREPLFYDDE
jgi:uncharacterized protein (TIGR02266 family)